MKHKKTAASEFTPGESELIQQLRQHPALRVRVQSILEIVRHAEGPLQSADEVEELVVAELRRLGNVTLSQWALPAEERVSTELRRQDPTVRSRKKKH